MKISTSASFVVASLALSSSTLGLPVPQTEPMPSAKSPDLAASPRAPHSARVFQESQLATVGRPGKGRPPAIRSGSGSRRALPRRSNSASKRADSNDKSLVDALGLSGLLDTVNGALGPVGLAIIATPAKETAEESGKESHQPLRFARQIPQFAPQLQQPPLPGNANQMGNSVAGTPGQYVPFGFPESIPQGEIPHFIAGYGSAAPAGQPQFEAPIGQPEFPSGFRGFPSQMMGQLQTGAPGLPAGQQQAGTVGEAVGQAPSELQNAVGDVGNAGAGGILSGLPTGEVFGYPGEIMGGAGNPLGGIVNGLPIAGQVGGLTGMLGSTFGQTAGSFGSGPLSGVTGMAGGLTGGLAGGLAGGLTGGLPFGSIFGSFQGGPPSDDQESASGDTQESSASMASPNTFDAVEPSEFQSSTLSSSTDTVETTTLPTISSSATSEVTESSASTTTTTSMDTPKATSTSDAEPTFAMNVAPDPAAVASSHSLPTGSHSLPVPAPVQSKAPQAPVPAPSPPGAPSPPVIHVQAPSPTPSGTESSTYFSSQSTSTGETTPTTTTSSSSATSSTPDAAPTTTMTVNPSERRMLLSRIMRYARRDAPLPAGFAAPTGPIPNDTPPLLKAVVKFPGDKAEKDQAPASTDADATTSVTSTATSESQAGSSSEPSSSSESAVMQSGSTSMTSN